MRPSPRIDRLPEAAAEPGAPAFDTEQLAAMSLAGARPEDIVARWRQDGARRVLHAADIVALARRGVPVPTLEALLTAREAALRTDADSRVVAAQARFSEQMAQQLAIERARPAQCPALPYRGFVPYGDWGYPGAWRGGFFRGW